MQNKPVVATMTGDPCGIGPEVVVKSLALGDMYAACRPVVVGCTESVQSAVDQLSLKLKVRRVDSVDQAGLDPSVIDVYDTGQLDPKDITPAKANAACGLATAAWLKEMDDLALTGKVQGTIMGPINTDALKMAGKLDQVISVETGKTYLFLITGPLRVVHLTDHIPLRQVCDIIAPDLVYKALRTIHDDFTRWGIPNPRIVVAGLNAHAYGEEDKTQIAPGVERAKAEGINVTGPSSPDSVFRWCIDGEYDVVLAMFHDQGHIAVKTWGFVGNCAMILGTPYIHMSVAHGTAFDIVGKGIASHEMILTAMRQAASLAGGHGFYREPAVA
ncbi:MAG: PdxA family dehydrogenase [Immundisolibacter sp.]|uniref:PdxA family dehydrogenase n=1 Tax=Immundisolibacter sp. TaxID=1934948 RepID=UPI003EE2EA0A